MTKSLKKLYDSIVAFMNAPGMRRPMAMMLTLILCAANLYAAGNGLAGINDLCHRRGGRSYRRCQGLWKVQLRRSRHIEDCRLLVRCLYIPCGSRHNSALVLPLIPPYQWNILSTRAARPLRSTGIFGFSPTCATVSISGICFSCGMGTSWTVKSALYAPRHRTRPTIYGK